MITVSTVVGRGIENRTIFNYEAHIKKTKGWAVVVAQLVERSLPIPEVRGSNPVIGKFYTEHLFTCLLSTALKRRK